MYIDCKSDYGMENYKVKKGMKNSKFRVCQWVEVGVGDELGLGSSTRVLKGSDTFF